MDTNAPSIRETEARVALPAQVQTEAGAIVTMLERMISDPTIDLSRIERVLELRRTIEQDTQRRAFNAAMAACKAELPQVVKNAENPDNHSRYATLDKIGEAIDAVIGKHGFSLSFNPGQSDSLDLLRIECTVAHADGHERQYRADLPRDAAGIKGMINKTAIHAWGSTMTYGRRYLTMMIFDVKSRLATPDDDGRAAGGQVAETIGPEDSAYVHQLLLETNSDEGRFLVAMRAESVESMTLDQFKRAIELLNRKRASGAAK